MSEYTDTSAEFSKCGLYRYTLGRWWSGIYGAKDFVNVIGLNPSTADLSHEDPTVRRMILFAKSWGYAGLMVTNIFAYRSTDPQKLYAELSGTMLGRGYMVPEYIIGPDNNEYIQKVAKQAALVVCAWGVHGKLLDRGKQVIDMLTASEIELYCLGVTKENFPKHPLYVKGDTQPRRFAL